MDDEGWFVDPFRLHQYRWVSDGEPTKLVRDEGVDYYDPPPRNHVEPPLTRAPSMAPDSPDSLKRADESETATTRHDLVEAAVRTFVTTSSIS